MIALPLGLSLPLTLALWGAFGTHPAGSRLLIPVCNRTLLVAGWTT